MKTKHIVIDAQNDFTYGALRNDDAINAIPNIRKELDKAVASGDEIFFTMDTHHKDYMQTLEGQNLPVPHCIMGTEGREIVNELLPYTEKAIVLNKNTFGFLRWKEYLEDADIVRVCGFCTDICVISNLLIIRAIFPNKRIILVENACAGVTKESHAAAVMTARACQIEIE